MKLAWSLISAPENRLMLDVFCELTPRDERSLKHSNKKLKISLKTVPVDFTMFDPRGLKFEKDHLDIEGDIVVGKKWELSDVFSFTAFDVADSRKAVIMGERIKTEIVCAMILAAPLAEFHGVVKTYDVDVECPKEISNMEHWRRSVLIRGS